MGLVAKGSRSSQTMMFKPESLTVVKVFNTFRQIAKVLIAFFLDLILLDWVIYEWDYGMLTIRRKVEKIVQKRRRIG